MHFENEVEQHTKLLIASYPRLLADKAQQTMLASIANAKKSPAFLTSVLSLLGMKAVLADPPENSDPNQLAILVSDALQDLLLATSTPATPGSNRAGADDVGNLPETTRTGGLAPANAPPGFLKYDNGGSIGELDTRSRSGDESDEEEKRSRGSVFEGLAVKPGTSHIANLLPYGSFTKDKFAEQVPLGRHVDKIVSLYYSSVQDGIVYVDPNESGLRIGDALLILEATPFPVKEVSEDNDKKKSNIFKICANKEVPVGTDFDYANEDFEPSKHDLQKNAALFVKQKLLIFTFIIGRDNCLSKHKVCKHISLHQEGYVAENANDYLIIQTCNPNGLRQRSMLATAVLVSSSTSSGRMQRQLYGQTQKHSE
jgi:hypothetical protein